MHSKVHEDAEPERNKVMRGAAAYGGSSVWIVFGITTV